MSSSVSSTPAASSATPSSVSSAAPPPPSSSAPVPPPSSLPASSDPVSSAPPPSSSAAPPSSTPASSSAPPTSSVASSVPPTSSAVKSTSTVTFQSLSTGADGGVVTLTQTRTQTSVPSATTSAAVRAATKGFLQNKGAVAAVFTIVGLVAAGLIFALVTSAIRRRKAKRFDREIAEEAKRAPAPVFVDDDDDYNGGYSTAAYGAGAGGYTDYGAAGHSPADAYAKSAAGHGPSSDGYPASNAVHSGEGTPSNYMYPSGYSDLGFSDVSSHGTYAQPPMDAYAAQGAGGAGYGAYGAAGMGAAGAGAGAYEMMGYGAHGGHTGYAAQQGQDWHAQNGQVQPQQAYVYPGEEQQGYPPAAPPPMTSHSTGSDLGRSKSGARSLVDSYGNTPPPDGSSGNVSGNGAAKPAAYADGYVSQYQTHVVDDDDAYGGVESHHGHVGNLEDEESDGEAGDGRRVLKVANN